MVEQCVRGRVLKIIGADPPLDPPQNRVGSTPVLPDVGHIVIRLVCLALALQRLPCTGKQVVQLPSRLVAQAAEVRL